MIGNITAGLYGVGAPPTAPGSYESIMTASIGSGGTSTIDFTSIPSTYKHLQLRFMYAPGYWGTLRFNNDTTGSNYRGHQLFGTGGAAVVGTSANVLYEPQSANGGGSIPYVGIIDIIDYSDISKYKTTRSIEGYDTNGGGEIYFTSGLWMSTSAINRITITSGSTNYGQNSSFALYGIKDS
jgi:hypothetical protein